MIIWKIYARYIFTTYGQSKNFGSQIFSALTSDSLLRLFEWLLLSIFVPA